MYELAAGVINVLEKKVFDKLDQERMLKAPDFDSAFEVLFDTDLGETAFNVSLEKDIEKIIEEDLKKLKNKLSKILKEEERLLWFLFLKFDALNLKIALKKAVVPSKTIDVHPFICSVESYEKIEEKITFLLAEKFKHQERKKVSVSEINPFVQRMAEFALEDIAKVPFSEINFDTSLKIEGALDKAYFNLRAEMAKELDPFLEEITKLEIDVANIKNALMAKEKKPDFIKKGNLKPEDLEKLTQFKEGEIFAQQQDLKEFLELFNISRLIGKFEKNKSETMLENGLMSFLTQKVLVRAKETGMGIERILAFFYKKMNSYFNIRLILFAKQNKIPISEIETILLPI